MRIQFLGHASFLITTSAGTKILTDPYNPGAYPGVISYSVFDEPVDIVTISHEHNDHKAVHLIKGHPMVIRGNGKFSAHGVEFWGVETFHDAQHGAKRGRNTVFIISADDLRIAHMGDLGHVLTADQASEIGTVDIVMIPTGGNFTIDARQAATVAGQIGAKIVIPMHYRTAKCAFDIAGVNEFTEGKPNVTLQKSSVLEVAAGQLPAAQQIIVLEPAL
ncbi:MAG: MBL fold metallo-hydrolase [Armatimonadota bacterium]|nr:MBL fold metallo-hydrolase [bacterium]